MRLVSPFVFLLLASVTCVRAQSTNASLTGRVTDPAKALIVDAKVIVVSAGTLPDNPAPPFSGAYKVVVLLTHRNFGATTDVVGIVEGPVLRIG